ncbi:MAG: DUF6647 family protein [Xanthobacteraceae bacterium]
MNALMTAMVLWLSVHFGLPATFEHPYVHFATREDILLRRYKAFTPKRRQEVLAAYAGAADSRVIAVYDESKRTILLPEGWSGSTPAELSILLHELVHHLQSAAGLRFECPAVSEKTAYEAQERWLGLFNLSLESEFQIDRFTLKVATTCAY